MLKHMYLWVKFYIYLFITIYIYFRSYELVPIEEFKEEKQPIDKMGDQTCQVVLAKGLLQIICLVGLLMPMAYIYVFTQDYEPFQRNICL